VVLPFQIRVYNPLTAEIASPWLTCSGQTTRNASLAGKYYHFTIAPSAGELRCGDPSNALIGAPAGVATAIFTGYVAPGSINTAFSVDSSTEALVWSHSGFEGGKARYYQRLDVADGYVYAGFKEVPATDFTPVSLIVQTLDTD
jgi:hypothetical protein